MWEEEVILLLECVYGWGGGVGRDCVTRVSWAAATSPPPDGNLRVGLFGMPQLLWLSLPPLPSSRKPSRCRLTFWGHGRGRHPDGAIRATSSTT